MNTIIRTCFACICALFVPASPSGAAVVAFNSFEGPPHPFFDAFRDGCVVNDLYLDTQSGVALEGKFGAELDPGTVLQEPEFCSGDHWLCRPGLRHYDSWLAPGIALQWGAPSATNIGFVFFSPGTKAEPRGWEPPAWDGLVLRLVLSPDAAGEWEAEFATRNAEGTLKNFRYSGTITDGSIDWPRPIDGDLNFDGCVNEGDLDIVRENWLVDLTNGLADPMILGDLGSGDASYDAAVTSADLDLVRANWSATCATCAAGAVPEPCAWVLIGTVAAGIMAMRGNRPRTERR